MRINKTFAMLLLSSAITTGCFGGSYEEAEALMNEGNYQDAKNILVKLAGNDNNDKAMYALYTIAQKHPDIVSEADSYGWLQRAADAGRPDAQYEYGIFLINHDKFLEGYDYLEKAATWHEDRAVAYLKQYGDIKNAQIGTERGDYQSMHDYAAWLLKQDSKELQELGVKYVRMSAMGENPDGQTLFGEILYNEKDYNAAMSYFEKVQNDNPKAMYYVGLMNLNAQGCIRNLTKAAEYIRSSAYKGYAQAQLMYGNALVTENNVLNIPNDYKSGVNFIKLATEQGLVEAEFTLATLYEEGKGVEKNFSKAMEYYNKSASKNYLDSKSRLGRLYIIHGINNSSKNNGIKLLEEAIKENDDPKAMAFLSLAYHKGLGVEQDDKKALELLEQASNHKDWFPRARLQLGVFYALGIGVEKDFTTAQYWIENSMKSPEDKQLAMACMAYMYDPSSNIYPNAVKHKHWLTLLKKNKGNYETLKEKLIANKYFD